MRPMLKNAAWERSGDDLHLLMGPEEQVVFADTDGMLDHLFTLLRQGSRSVPELQAEMSARWPQVAAEDITEALLVFDGLGLLIDAAEPDLLTDWQRERSFSNLAFFTTYASLTQSAASFQRALADAHVLFLGTGGLGSTAIQALTGAGVGRMTLVDGDRVELRNLARQYLYREEQIGGTKAELAAQWVRAFHSQVDVRAVVRWITGPDDVAGLLDGVDFVVDGADHPQGIDAWVDQACVAAGVPYVRGGMSVRRVLYWSVDPGRGPCLSCRRQAAAAAQAGYGVPLRDMALALERTNRGIGPVASLAGALVAIEALRYLTGFAEPIAARSTRSVDLATGQEDVVPWEPWPECAVCPTAPSHR